MNRKHAVLIALLVLEVVVFTMLERAGGAASTGVAEHVAGYLAGVLEQSAPALALAFGMTLVLATGGIDLSVGSMAALIACVLASFEPGASFWYTAVPAGLALSLVLGLTNGLLIAGLEMPPIIATLGTMILYRGFCFVVLGDLERAPFFDVPGWPALGELPFVVAMVAVLWGGAGTWVARSRWRREVLFLGGNRVAARYAGLRVFRRTVEVYTISGLLAFLAAVTFTARNFSANAETLRGFELEVIVAVVLGGTRVEGGTASLLGSFLGVLVIALLEEGLRGASLWAENALPFHPSHLRYIVLGLLLVGAVSANSRRGTRGVWRKGAVRSSPRRSPDRLGGKGSRDGIDSPSSNSEE